MKTVYFSLVALLLFFSVSSTFAQNIFMEMAPAPGSAMIAVNGEIQLSSLQFSLENKATVGSATSGAGGGKVQFNELVITKQLDGAASPSIQKAIVAGQHYQRIRLNFYRQAPGGGPRQLVYRVSLGTCFVTKYETSAADGCENGCPGLNETITIAYGQIIYSDYAPVLAGTATQPKIVEWDQVKNIGSVTIEP